MPEMSAAHGLLPCPVCRKFYVGGGNPDDFYTSSSARQAFKNHMKTVVNRVNTITGTVNIHFFSTQTWDIR